MKKNTALLIASCLILLISFAAISAQDKGSKDRTQAPSITVLDFETTGPFCRNATMNLRWTSQDIELLDIVVMADGKNEVPIDTLANISAAMTQIGIDVTPYSDLYDSIYFRVQPAGSQTPNDRSYIVRFIPNIWVNEIEGHDTITQATHCQEEDILLFVTASGHKLRYLWYENGLLIEGSNNDSIYVSAKPDEFEQVFKAVAIDSCGYKYIFKIHSLDYDPIPKFQKVDTEYIFCQGDQMLLTLIIANAGETGEAQWYKDGEKFNLDEDAQMNTLTVSNITTDFEGEYYLEIENICRTVKSQVLNVVVDTPIEITSESGETELFEGETAKFEVVYSSRASESYWTKDGIKINDSYKPTLIIPDVSDEDEGRYEFVIINKCGSVVSKPYHLNVISQGEKPKLSVSADILEYGELIESNQIITREITFKNLGVGEIPVHILGVTGVNSGEFKLDVSGKIMVSKSSPQKITITFKPSLPGTKAAVLKYESELTGQVEIPITGQVHAFEYDLVNAPVNFEDVIINSQKIKRFQVGNKSDVALTISDYKFSGLKSSDFHFENELPLTINPAEYEDIDIRFEPTKIGSYFVELTFKFEGTDKEIIVGLTGNSVPLSVENLTQDSRIKIFPNPAQNVLNVTLPDDLVSANARFDIYDLSGTKIHSADLDNSQSVQIDLSAIASGSYYLVVNTNEGGYFKKFSIVR